MEIKCTVLFTYIYNKVDDDEKAAHEENDDDVGRVRGPGSVDWIISRSNRSNRSNIF